MATVFPPTSSTVTPGTNLIGTKARVSGLLNPSKTYPQGSFRAYNQSFFPSPRFSGTGFLNIAQVNASGTMRVVFDLGCAGVGNLSGSVIESNGRAILHKYRGGISIATWGSTFPASGGAFGTHYDVNTAVENGDIFKFEYGVNSRFSSGTYYTHNGECSGVDFYTAEGITSAITIL